MLSPLSSNRSTTMRWGNTTPQPPEEPNLFEQLAAQLAAAKAAPPPPDLAALAHEFTSTVDRLRQPPLALDQLNALVRWGICQHTPDPKQPLYATKLWKSAITQDFEVADVRASHEFQGAFEINQYTIDHKTGQLKHAQRTVLATGQSSLPDLLHHNQNPPPIRQVLATLGYKEP
jgi:hypothetical protein